MAEHWCRVIMNQKTKTLVNSLDRPNMDAVEISGRSWKKHGWRNYRSLYYPEFDICNTDLVEMCDFVGAEQVFEHVRHPFRAARNVFNMLRPGGYFMITTPFFLKVHGAPDDFWRWTPHGLQAMLEDVGFSVSTVESWGNRDCIVANLDQWADHQPGQDLDNNLDLPIMVWALARRP